MKHLAASWAIPLFLLFPVDRGYAEPTFGAAVSNGMVTISGLSEASGLACSRNNDGVIWTHNDSGHPAQLFTVDTQGRALGVWTVPGATNVDWEDLSYGPGPVSNITYLFIGDIGDNNSVRTSMQIYQVPEPAVYLAWAAAPRTSAIKGVRGLTLTYPNGAHNAEALFVDPWTGDAYIAIKTKTTSKVYRATKAEMDATNVLTLTLVANIAFDVPNGADISPTGLEIVMRQEDYARLWSRTNGQSVADAISGPYTAIPVVGRPVEPNGEAIGFDDYGGGYFTLSDSSTEQPLYFFPRTSSDSPTPPRSLVPMAGSWKFLADGSNQGTAYTITAFNDSSWSTGNAQLGYGDGDEQTVVPFAGPVTNKNIATYFRKAFAVTNAAAISTLTLKMVCDDGALVWLNGTQILALNLATNAAFNAPATPMPVALRDTWQRFAVDPRLLHDGTNIVAAGVHVSTPAATSMSFDLQLCATEAPLITQIHTPLNQQAQITITGSGRSPTVVQTSPDLGNWATLGSVILTNRLGSFTDTQATNVGPRFYRAWRPIP